MIFDLSYLGQILTYDQKTYHQSRVLVESSPRFFSLRSKTLSFETRGGLRPPPLAKVAKYGNGRGLNSFVHEVWTETFQHGLTCQDNIRKPVISTFHVVNSPRPKATGSTYYTRNSKRASFLRNTGMDVDMRELINVSATRMKNAYRKPPVLNLLHLKYGPHTR